MDEYEDSSKTCESCQDYLDNRMGLQWCTNSESPHRYNGFNPLTPEQKMVGCDNIRPFGTAHKTGPFS